MMSKNYKKHLDVELKGSSKKSLQVKRENTFAIRFVVVKYKSKHCILSVFAISFRFV